MKTKLFFALILLSISLIHSAWSGQLIYSTLLGGSGTDYGTAIVVDSAGNAYITGQTNSTDFASTTSAFDTTNKYFDVFVTKLNPTGTGLVYSTYLGGIGEDLGCGITVDNRGNAYITGYTRSTDFPTTAGAINTVTNGVSDVFVTKLDPSGTDLVYSTYLGGNSNDAGEQIAIDSSGNAYITGYTYSNDFPTTPNAFDTSYNGNGDTFISKLNPTGTKLLYSTYLGGSGADWGYGIAIDTTGNAYITGYTQSGNFPITPGAFDTSYYNKGIGDAFVCKLNSTGTGLIYSTYLGGVDDDIGKAIAVDTVGSAYITGNTLSDNFPTSPDALDNSYHGHGDAFVSKLNSIGTGLLYSTYIGGQFWDISYSIALDYRGNIYITGETISNDYPTTPGALDASGNSGSNGGGTNGFVTVFNPGRTGLIYSTYLSGSNYQNYCNGITADTAGNAYIIGVTSSDDFPTTPFAYDTSFNGNYDAFVSKIYTVYPPPSITRLPSLKLFTNQSLNPGFNLEDYNNGGMAANYSIVSNFLSLSSLSSNVVYQSDYSSATSGTNTYELENSYGAITVNNKIKYSSYKIKRLPQVVLRPNRSWDVNVGNYTIDSSNNLVSPPSFNQIDSLMVSDTTKLSASWSDESTVTITALTGFTIAQSVDVIASPQSTAPYGADIDKERIEVYPSLSTTAFEFSNSSDTSLFSYQLPSGITNLATIGYSTTIDDVHGGALQITFTSPSSGVKITPKFSTWMRNTPKTWYTLRVRVFGTNTANSYLQFFFNGDYGKTPMDIQGYYRYSVPTTWTYIDIPINSFASVSSAPVMYPQLVLKANGGTGIIYIDEIEIFQATPPLLTSRYKTFDNYVGGSWKNSSATTQWAKETLSGSGSINVLDGQLYVNTFGNSTTQTTLKFTASTANNTIYTIPSNLGNQAGMHMSTQLVKGITNLSQTQVQVNLLGTNTNGSFITNGDMASAAEIGRVSNRTLQLAFNANSPYYQIQFIVKNTGNSSFQIDNTLADIDNDDPNYGDATLFP